MNQGPFISRSTFGHGVAGVATLRIGDLAREYVSELLP